MPQVDHGHFGDGSRWGVKITYSIEERALGTAGGLKKVASFFDREPTLPSLVWRQSEPLRSGAAHRGTIMPKAGWRPSPCSNAKSVIQSGIVGLDSR